MIKLYNKPIDHLIYNHNKVLEELMLTITAITYVNEITLIESLENSYIVW